MMSKFKRTAAVFLAAVMLLGLFSCSNAPESAPDDTDENKQTETDTVSPITVKGISVSDTDTADTVAVKITETKPGVVGLIGASDELCASLETLLTDYSRVFDAHIFVRNDGFKYNGQGTMTAGNVSSESTTVTRISDGTEFECRFADIGAVDETYSSLGASKQFVLDFEDSEGNLLMIARFADENGGEVLRYLDRNAAPAIEGGSQIWAFADDGFSAEAVYGENTVDMTVTPLDGPLPKDTERKYVSGGMNYENLRRFAYHNGELIEGEVKGVVIYFKGLGDQTTYSTDTYYPKHFAADGILFVIPYVNVFGWMSNKSVVYADQVLDVLFEHFNLPESTPIVSTGQSMGGLAGIIYCRYGKRTPIASVTNCPVCDMFDRYEIYIDSIYDSLLDSGYDNIDDALRDRSPIHIAAELPDIPYVIYQSAGDKVVPPDVHAEPFIAKMNALGYTTEYVVVPDRDHVDLGIQEEDFYADMAEFILNYNE